MILSEQLKSLSYVKSKVASLLLSNSRKCNDSSKQLTQRDMATMLDTDWGLIHLSLKSLCSDGLIRIDRNRIVITKALVELAATAV